VQHQTPAPAPTPFDDYLLTLDRLIDDLQKRPSFLDLAKGKIRSDVCINDIGGPEILKAKILKALEPDLLRLIKTGELRLSNLKNIPRIVAPVGHQMTIYVHVIYNKGNIGIYVGQAWVLRKRISAHKRDRRRFLQRLRTGRRRTKNQNYFTAHTRFWAQKGTHDFWLKFAQLAPLKSNDQRREKQLLLNVLEKYAALLFRTLPCERLAKDLPRGSKIDPYPWVGLNRHDPLEQTHRNATLSRTGSTSRTSLSVIFGNKLPVALNVLWRYADPSQGDQTTVLVICSKCRSPWTGYMDRAPRYEISTRVYLASLARTCEGCGSDRYVPADESLPFKFFNVIKRAYNRMKPQASAEKVDLGGKSVDELAVWIRFQGFHVPESGTRDELLDRAESICNWLLDNKQHEKPPMSVKKVPVVYHHNDLKKLHPYEIEEWIKSRGFSSGVRKPKTAWLKMGEAILHGASFGSEIDLKPDDEPDEQRVPAAHQRQGLASSTSIKLRRRSKSKRHEIIEEDPAEVEIKSRGELDQLSLKQLIQWIRSKGQRVSSEVKKAAALGLAQAIWEDPILGQQRPMKKNTSTVNRIEEPKSRAGLGRMSMNDLQKWLKCKGMPQNWGPNYKKDILAYAEETWDAIQNGTLGDLARNADPSRIRDPKTREDIPSLTRERLFEWIKAQGHLVSIIRSSPKVSTSHKEDFVRLAEEIWDAKQEGRLQELIDEHRRRRYGRGSTDAIEVPQTREEIRLMKRRDLVKWIQAQKYPVSNIAKKKLFELAERIWDAIHDGRLQELLDGHSIGRYKRGSSKLGG
jgi:hypothetical protein